MRTRLYAAAESVNSQSIFSTPKGDVDWDRFHGQPEKGKEED